MKAIITIIVLLLIGWGIWYATRGEDVDNQAANVGGALNAEVEQDGGEDIDLGEFEDKG